MGRRLKQGPGRFAETTRGKRARQGLEVVSWASIGEAGEESRAVGCLWDLAPAWQGQSAVWVRTLRWEPGESDPTLADAMIDEEDFGPTVLVARAHRRCRAGLPGRGGTTRPGRWIEKGEHWNDPAMRDWARRERERPAPTRIRGIVPGSVDEVMIRQWAADLERLVRS